MRDLVRVNTRHGPMIAFEHDRFITPCLKAYGEISPAELDVLKQLAGGGVVVEVGANIGVHTIPLAKACRRVYAFEPQQRVFQVLCANLVLNGLTNVVAVPDAGGAAPGWARIPPVNYGSPLNTGGVALVPAGQAGEPVRVTPLDSLELERVTLLKIDVEGFEMEVVEGARQLIARDRPRIYIENDRIETQAALVRRLRDLGYRMWWNCPPLNPDGAESIFGQRLSSMNMICLPSEGRATVTDSDPIDPDNVQDPKGRPQQS